MKVVFVHRRGPGQFVHLACHLANAGWQVSLLCETMNVRLPGVRILRHRSPSVTPGTTISAQHIETGHHAAETLNALVQQEGPPDVVFGHIGWGSMMFARDVLPHTPLLGYCEHFYHAEGRDVGFAPDDTVSLEKRKQLRLRNSAQLLTLDQMNAGVSPTQWQRSAYPANLRGKIGVCHDGIDTRRCRPDNSAQFTLPDGRKIDRATPVITYVARDLEPYRGFPQFMQAAEKVAKQHPEALFLVAGGDGVSYGAPAPDGRPWREVMMEQTGLDPSRIVFLGQIPHDQLVKLFQVSRAHVYLTYPFVLSWSVLEAMACGTPVIGSRTPPVEEIIQDGENGLLTDFWDPETLAGQISQAIRNPEKLTPLRENARRSIVDQFDLQRCLTRQTAALERLRAAS
jgi:glycosyltransferase involved in cell wall biosynthesis